MNGGFQIDTISNFPLNMKGPIELFLVMPVFTTPIIKVGAGTWYEGS